MKQRIIIICGPTAVGKTGMGATICKRFDGEVVSADSQQVYRGMDIGTAKDDLAGTGIKCHLIDIINPDEPFDVSIFKNLADEAIKGIVSRGKLPVIVGGTGFYIRVLLEGLCEAPARDEEIREELYSIKEREGSEALHEILKREDPVMAERLNEKDHQRVVRAIEVKLTTEKSLLEFQKNQEIERHYDSLKIGLNTNRIRLYQKINERVDQMIERGLLDEVKGIVDKYGPDLQSLKAVGYKEIVAFLNGDIDLEEAVFLTKRNTRRFAKRQLTWFRSDPEIHWFDAKDLDGVIKNVEIFLKKV